MLKQERIGIGENRKMAIQKTIVITYIVQDVREDAFIFDEVWRVKRGNKSYKGFECFNCGREFKNNERFGFIVTDKGNKTVCNKCAKEIKEKLDKTIKIYRNKVSKYKQ
jgi:hypothetical protein